MALNETDKKYFYYELLRNFGKVANFPVIDYTVSRSFYHLVVKVGNQEATTDKNTSECWNCTVLLVSINIFMRS